VHRGPQSYPVQGLLSVTAALTEVLSLTPERHRPTHDSHTRLHNTNNKCRFVECDYLKHAPKCPVNRCVFKSCKNVQSQQLVTHQSFTVLVCNSAIFHHLSMPNKLNSIISFNHFKSLHNSVSQKKSPLQFSDIFPKWLGIVNQFLHTYYTFLSTLDYKFLFNYL